jgi:hydrogenase maturation protein HypF
LHPDYHSSRFAETLGKPIVRVQHHCAHVLACMAEHGLKPPLLGIAWDGTGWGLDKTVWGGEFLQITADGFQRFAHLRPFALPGGERAVFEPWRIALSLLAQLGEREALEELRGPELKAKQICLSMIERGVNSPMCSSMGRLFDGVSALLGICQETTFEGQPAMELEFALPDALVADAYPMEFRAGILDWHPLLRELLADLKGGVSRGVISAKFHNALCEGALAVARASGETRLALSGGCFQNAYLTERLVERLRGSGFEVFCHRDFPPNDNCIALGQIYACSLGGETKCV